MHEDLKLHLWHGIVDGLDFLDRQLPGKHRAREAKVAKPRHFFRRAVVHLGGRVEQRGAPHLAQSHAAHGERGHVLHEDGIHPDLGKPRDELLRGIELVVIDDGVDGDIHFRPELMGEVAQGTDVADAVACRGARAEVVGADIHGIGTVADGGNAALQVLGRGQEFQCSHVWKQMKGHVRVGTNPFGCTFASQCRPRASAGSLLFTR